MRILLIEDCKSVADVIFDYFEDSHIELDYAATGPRGLKLAKSGEFDCIILDLMLPGMDGITLCQTLRELGVNTPIIMLTARDTQADMLLGLRQGADDYIVKPFDLELLEARIDAVIRRSSGSGFKTRLVIADLVIDLKSHSVIRQDHPIQLNPSCYKILKLLAERHPAIASREEIEQMLWPDDLPDQDVLRKHIYQLRSKVDKPFATELIKTVPKRGYKLEAQ